MTTNTNKRIRFMTNNMADVQSSSLNKSSELSNFPASNAIDSFRSKVWVPSGYFKVTTGVDDSLYINDGAPKTVTITAGTYQTPALLAAQIQTDLNAVSANWTVAYDSAGETYKFTISNTGSVTLVLSNSGTAIWDKLGFTLVVDQVGTSFTAQRQRNHDEEFLKVDMGAISQVDFIGVISPLGSVFPISKNAVIKIQANNMDDFTAPPLDITLTTLPGGIMRYFDDIADSNFRFWRFSYVDREDPEGPESVSLAQFYLGTFTTIENRNVVRGFGKELVDPSDTEESESGALYFDKKTTYIRMKSLAIQHLDRSDKDALNQMYFNLGKTTPFYISLDPKLELTDSLDELTKYVTFEGLETQHVANDIFTMNFQVREAI